MWLTQGFKSSELLNELRSMSTQLPGFAISRLRPATSSGPAAQRSSSQRPVAHDPQPTAYDGLVAWKPGGPVLIFHIFFVQQ